MKKKDIAVRDPFDQTTPSDRFDDVVKKYKPGSIVSFSKEKNTHYFHTDNLITLKVEVISTDIIRFRYALKNDFEADFSYARCPDFQPSETVSSLEEWKTEFKIKTGRVICRIKKKGMTVHLYDDEGRVLCEDTEGFYLRESILEGTSLIKVTKKAPKGKLFFGLGDKGTRQNLRGKSFENWNTDSYGFDESTDPLYRSIPFYYALFEGRAYGIFLDNSYRTFFNFDSKKKEVSNFATAGGEMNYYFIYGPSLMEVAEKYTDLTGKPKLPPLWALGFHQSKWSYYPETKVQEIADGFRERKIPCDVIYLDIDYMDEYRCFTWNNDHFPDPGQMISDLKKKGFKTIVMIDPGIKADPEYWVAKEGKEKDYFCRRGDGTLFRGPVWPSDCYFPDFTNPEVREWWATLYRGLISEDGVDAVWNDMNEPAVFEVNHKTFPDDVRHDYDGHPTNHSKAHNIYGLQMARATQKGLQDLLGKKRAFVLTRATFSGGQRFAAVWTGDNAASWQHLNLANMQCQRLSISGFSFVGSDIGGFIGKPSGELFVRWLQMGVFQPFFRVHSMGDNLDGAAEVDKEKIAEHIHEKPVTEQEPWSFGEPYTKIAQETISLRYQLIPYLYTALWQSAIKGTPAIRPLSFFNQFDHNLLKREEEFMLGDHLLIAPIKKPKVTSRKVYLPEGQWFDFNTCRPLEGGQTIKSKAPLNQIPIFIRAGAVIALNPTMQYVGEKEIEELTLHVYYCQGSLTSYLYEDDGESTDYQYGHYSLKSFLIEGDRNELIIKQNKEGIFQTPYSNYRIFVHGLPFTIQSVAVDDRPITLSEKELIISSRFEKLVISK